MPFTEPTAVGRGSLLKIEWSWTATAALETTARLYNGRFLGVYWSAAQIAETVTITIKAHGVDLLDGLGTLLNTTSKWLPAITDIAGTNTQAQDGLPIHGNLLFQVESAGGGDNGTAFAYIRIPGHRE